jgi:myo-inositol-1(or 4)-monophosphatase
MQPWDWAALVPVIEGAGGRVTDWQGQALRFGCDGNVLAVGDAALLEPAIRLLTDK